MKEIISSIFSIFTFGFQLSDNLLINSLVLLIIIMISLYVACKQVDIKSVVGTRKKVFRLLHRLAIFIFMYIVFSYTFSLIQFLLLLPKVYSPLIIIPISFLIVILLKIFIKPKKK